MKKFSFIYILIYFFNYTYGQDVATLVKLHNISTSLGVTTSISVDTLIINAKNARINYKVTEQQDLLLRAAEYYSNKDYENAGYYVKRVVLIFKNNDLNNLKYIIQIGSYANLKNIRETAKHFYLARKLKQIAPENMKIIINEIKINFTKDNFMDALANFYYYHKRLAIIDEMKFEK
jgi:hypothetical protein